MVEHCPDWAKEIWNYKVTFFEDIHIKDKDMDELEDCMVSQLVAEWLELDQIEWNSLFESIEQSKGDSPIIWFRGIDEGQWLEQWQNKKIGFFSDEV